MTRQSDGLVVYLDEEQGAVTHTLVMQLVQTDNMVNDVDAVCTPENPCGEPMFGEETSSDPEVSFTLGTPVKFHRGGGRVGVTVTFPKDIEKSKGNKGVQQLNEDFSCSEIGSAMILDKVTYRSNRTNPLKHIVATAVGEGISYLAGKVIPPLVWAGANVVGAGSGIATSHVKYTMLAGLWNAKGCGNRPVVVSTWNPVGGAGPGPREYLYCQSSPGSLTINGQTISLWIEVCWYEDMD